MEINFSLDYLHWTNTIYSVKFPFEIAEDRFHLVMVRIISNEQVIKNDDEKLYLITLIQSMF